MFSFFDLSSFRMYFRCAHWFVSYTCITPPVLSQPSNWRNVFIGKLLSVDPPKLENLSVMRIYSWLIGGAPVLCVLFYPEVLGFTPPPNYPLYMCALLDPGASLMFCFITILVTTGIIKKILECHQDVIGWQNIGVYEFLDVGSTISYYSRSSSIWWEWPLLVSVV